MSLAKLFYLKENFRQQVRRWRQAHFRRRLASSPDTSHRSRYLLEALEPRILLSATPLEFTPDDLDQAVELTLTIVDEVGGSTVQLRDQNDQVVRSQALADTSSVQITGSNFADRLSIDSSVGSLLTWSFMGGLGADELVGADLSNEWVVTGEDTGTLNDQSFSSVENLFGGVVSDNFSFKDGASLSGSIEGQAGNNTLDYSADTSGITVDLGLRQATGINEFNQIDRLFGGFGDDLLIGPASDTTWNITGDNAGTVAGLTFSGFENLAGAADNEDTFFFEPFGSLSGVAEGGDGGFDTIVLAGGTFDRVTYTANGADSGSIARDADLIRYVGMEPLQMTSVTAAEIVFDGTDNRDLATFRRATIQEGTGFIIESGAVPTFESVQFNAPSDLLTINLGGGDELLVKSIGDFDANFTVNGQGTGNLTLLGSADPDKVLFEGDANFIGHNLKVEAEIIEVKAGAVVMTTGDITLLARDTGIKELEDLGPLNFAKKTATIDIGAGAEISGKNLIIRSEAADKSFTSLLGTSELFNEFIIDPLVNDLSGFFDLPFKVLFKESDARVTVNENVVLTGTAGVTLEADSIADASQGGAADTATASRFPVTAAGDQFAVGYVQAISSAIVDVKAGVNISAGEAVAINADGTAVALLKTETDSDLGEASSIPSLSLAITRTDITSQTLVAAGVTITAGKTVNITAEGLEDSEAEAESGLFTDGSAGLAFGLSFSNANINSVVNGTVTAQMDPGSVVKLEFDPTVTDTNALGFVDTINNTIKVGGHALATGDKIEYSNRRGTSIGPVVGGLTDGDVFFVITTADSTKIQLAETRDKAIAGDEISLAGGAAVNSKSFDVTTAVDSAKDTITLANPAFTGSGTDFSLLGSTFELGQAVRYNANGSTPIEGLVAGQTYYVITGTNQFNLQGDVRFVDKQVIQLAETENESRAGVAINLDAVGTTGIHKLTAMHVLDSGLATGIGVLASLDTTTKGIASSGIADKAQDTEVTVFEFEVPTLFDVLTAGYDDNAGKSDSGASPKLQVAGAVGFVKATHTVTADVGANAVLKSNEDLEVKAEISQALQINAESSVETVEGDQAAATTISAAVIVGLVDNTAQATVASGADLDALRAARVISDVSYPYLTRPDEFVPANLGELSDLLKSEGLDAVNDYGDGTLGLQSKLFNTWARSSGQAGGTAVAGSVNFLDIRNISEATVRSGAQINQDLLWRDSTLNPHGNNTDQQVVSVEATNYMQVLNVTGVFDFQLPEGTLDPLSVKFDPKLSISPVASEGGKGGVGGAIFISLLDNTTTALVESGVALYSGSSGSFNMKAEEAIMNFNFSQAGAEGGKYGIGGTVAYVEQDSKTRAQLASGAIITGGTDPNETDVAGSPVTIYAGSLETNINWAGAVAKGENLGFGITVAINDIDRDTSAIIGNIDPAIDVTNGTAPGTTTDINPSGALKVDAKVIGDLWAFTVAAAKGGGAKPATSTTPESPVGGEDGKKPKYGIGISANVSINAIKDDVHAYIHDAGGIQAPSIELVALNETDLFAFGAAASAVLPSSGSGSSNSASIAGSFSKNSLTGNTQAFIKGENTGQAKKLVLRPANELTLSADRKGKIQAITAGIAVAVERSGNSLAVAGSVSLNEITNETAAFMSGVNDDLDPDNPSAAASIYDVSIQAQDSSSIFALAGAVSIGVGGGNLGVGFSLGINTIDNNTAAYVDNSQLVHVENLIVSATNSADIHSITASGSLAVGDNNQIALAGSVSINTIDGDAIAYISNGARMIARGDVVVRAMDMSTIQSDGGGVSIGVKAGGTGSGGSGALGISLAFNEVTNITQASIDGATVTADDITVTAEAKGTTAKQFNFVKTAVASGTDILTWAGHELETGDRVVYRNLGANGGEIDGLENGRRYYVIKVNDNQIKLATTRPQATDATPTPIDLTTVSAGTNHQLETVEPTIDALSFAGAGGGAVGSGTSGAFSAAGAGASNTVNSRVEAFIKNSPNSVTARTGDVSVIARDASSINADVVGASLSAAGSGGGNAGTLSVGVSIARNKIDNVLSASIDGSTVTTTLGGINVQVVEDATISAFSLAASVALSGSSGGSSLALSGGGAEAVNVIGTKANAFVNKSVLNSKGDVEITAENTSTIEAVVVAVSVSVSGSSGNAGAASIGAAVAHNFIGYDEAGNRLPDGAQVQAYVEDSSITATTGDLRQTANSDQIITATVLAGSVALSGGSTGAGALGGAGVSAVNKIATGVRAYIKDAPGKKIAAGNIVLTARDTSVISADAGAASIAAAFAPAGPGVSVAIGVALAENAMSNVVESYISGVPTVEARGQVKLDALEAATITTNTIAASLAVGVSASGFGVGLSGAGANATNVIENKVHAYISGSTVTSTNDSLIAAESRSTITALVGALAAAGAGGAGGGFAGAIGVSLSRNLIGLDSINDPSPLGNEVLAYVTGSEVTSNTGNVTISATSIDNVDAVTFAGSVAIAGGAVGGAAAGAGAEVTNQLSTRVEAYINQSDVTATVGNIKVTAISDSEIIRAKAFGVAVAASLAPAGAAISVAVSIVDNDIKNTVQAYVMGTAVDRVEAGGDISIMADARVAKISDASALTTSVSGGLVGVAGGGVDISNVVHNTVKAHITGPVTVMADGNVEVIANEHAQVQAESIGVTASISIGAAIGVSIVENEISSTIEAALSNADVRSVDTTITATSVANIIETKSFSVAASAVGVGSIEATAQVSTAVKASTEDAIVHSTGAVRVEANSTLTAKAEGKGYAAGVVGVGVVDTESIIDGKTEAKVGGGTITADTVSIISNATNNVVANIDAGTGGVVAVSGSTSTAELTNQNTAVVGADTIIDAVGNFALRANSENTGTSTASNDSGGVVAVDLTTAELTMTDQSTVEVGVGADIRAGNNLVVESLVTAIADTDATVNNGGFVASPNSNATTTLDVTANANLLSNINLRGENVTIQAEIIKIDADARASSSVGAAVPIARSQSKVETNTSALITLASMAVDDSITAQNTLSIIAKQADLSTVSTASSDADGFAGTKQAIATTIQNSTTRVSAQDETRLAARNLLVKADSEFLPTIVASASTPGFVLFSSDTEDEHLTFDQTREILFPAKVSLLSAPSPELLIGENGEVLTKKNLTLNNDTVQLGDTYTNGEIVVDAIANNNPLFASNVTFIISPVFYDTALKPPDFTTLARIVGNPEFTPVTGFGSVTIISAADRALRINAIDVINPFPPTAQTITVNVADKAGFTPQFKDPIPGNTPVTITNEGNGNLLLSGVINNPFGNTVITSDDGDILATNAGVRIVTETLTLDSPLGQVGTSAQLIKTRTGPDSLSGSAATDFFVSEAGHLDVDTIVAGGTVNLKATGSIRDSRGDDAVNITASTVRLSSQSGQIGGGLSDPLEIDATDETARALFATADGDIVIDDVNNALYLGTLTSNNGNIAITVDDSVDPGDDLVLTATTQVRAVNGTVTLFSGDDFLAPAGSLINGANGVTIGGDVNDQDGGVGAAIDLLGTMSGSPVLIRGGGDVDRIALVGVRGATTIEAGGDADVIHIGSNATSGTNSNGTLADVDALLTVIGLDDGDTLSLDDTGSTGPRSGGLTATTLTGFAMSGSIVYTGVSNLDLNLGSFTDTLVVTSTDDQTVTTIDLGGGADSVTVSDAGQLDSISGILTILGGAQADALVIDDSMDADPSAGMLDVAVRVSLIGFGMGAADNATPNDQKGIRYGGFEAVHIGLGLDVDQLSIGGVQGETTVDLGGGADQIMVGPSLSGISDQVVILGGAGADALSINPGVKASLTLDRASAVPVRGVITAAAATGTIAFESIDLLSFEFAGTDDALTIRDTTVPVTVQGNAGTDVILVENVSHLTDLDLGDDDDTVTIQGARAPIAVHASDAPGDDDELIIDLTAETAVIDGEIRGGGTDPTIPGFNPAVDATANTGTVSVADSAFITMPDIYFDDVEKVSVLLGTGNDIFDIDSRFADPGNAGALTDAFSDTVVTVDGGGGNDEIFALAIASAVDTNVAGGDNQDQLLVSIAGFPVEGSFTGLNADVETLIIDNSTHGPNTGGQAVAWTQQDGDLLLARQVGQPQSENFAVISTQGADVVRVLGSQLNDTLDVVTTSGGDVQGRIDGNQIELRSGLEVLTLADVDQFQNFDQVIDFTGMADAVIERVEDGFIVEAIDDLVVVTDAAVQAATRRTFNLDTRLSAAAVADVNDSFVLTTNDNTAFALNQLSLGFVGTGTRMVTLTGVSINGKTVTTNTPLTVTGDEGLIVFQDEIPATFTALKSVVINAQGVVIDNIVATKIPELSGTGQTATASVATTTFFPTSGGSATLGFNTDTGSLFAPAGGVSFSGTPVPTSRLDPNDSDIRQWLFTGNVIFKSGLTIIATGSKGASFQIPNDVTIESGVKIDVSAVNQTAGTGGGTGGSARSGGNGGFGGSARGFNNTGGSAGGAGNFFNTGGSGGGGGSGVVGDVGDAGTAGLSGTSGLGGINSGGGGAGGAGGARGTGGGGGVGGIIVDFGPFNLPVPFLATTATVPTTWSGLSVVGSTGGLGGGGGGGGGILATGSPGGAGTAGGDGGLGEVGKVGQPGLKGANNGTGLQISAGGGGGAGGTGGGGGGGGSGGSGGAGGGGGGGGGAGAGSGGSGKSGANSGGGGRGGFGGLGGTGGGGGGAFEIVANGRVTIANNNGSNQGLFAKGGAGVGGNSQRVTPGAGSDGGAASATGPNGGGVNGGGGQGGGGGGGDGRDGRVGGTGGPGAGGAGGTVKVQGTVIDANNVTVSAQGGFGPGLALNGNTGRFILVGDDIFFNVARNAGNTGGITNVVASNSTFVGPRITNTFLSNNEAVARIAGLKGGADVFGILAGVTDEDLGLTFGADALAAVIRLDKVPAPLIGAAGNVDDYDNFDVVLFANLTDVALTAPKLNVLLNGSTTNVYDALAVRGLGSQSTMTRIGPNEVWATLIPDETVTVNASLFGDETKTVSTRISTVVDALGLIDGVGNARLIKAVQPSSSVVPAQVPGFDAIAASADGARIYGVNAQLGALVVANGDNGSQRQLVKDGFGGVTTLGGASAVALYEDPVGANGSFVYVAAPGDQRLNVFSVDGTTGDVAFRSSTGLASSALGVLAISGGDGTTLFSAGASFIVQYSRNPSTGAIPTFDRFISQGADDLALSADDSVLFAVNAAAGTLTAYSAASLATLGSLGTAEVNALDGASDVVLDDDGFIYVTSSSGNTLAVFRFDAGTLSHIQTHRNGSEGVRGMTAPSDVQVSPDGRFVLVSGGDSNALSVFQKRQELNPDTGQREPTGELIFVQVLRDNVDGVDGLGKASSIAVAVLNAGTASETHVAYVGTLNSGGDASLASFVIARDLPDPIQTVTEFSGIEQIGLKTAGGSDNLSLIRAPDVQVTQTTIDSGGNDDLVVLFDASATTTVSLGGGDDHAQLRSTRAGTSVVVNGDADQDTIDIDRTGTSASIEAFGDAGQDTFRILGMNLPASATTVIHGNAPSTLPGDTLVFDPQDPTPNSPNFTNTGTTIRVNGLGIVNYDTIETVRIFAAPIVSFVGAPYVTNEGQNQSTGGVAVTLQASVFLPNANDPLIGPVEWDLDGDGQFGEATGLTLALTWDQLVDFGFNDDGVYQIGVRGTNSLGSAEAFTTLTINNTLPTVTVTGDAAGLVGEAIAVQFSATDPGEDEIFKWAVNWGDASGIEEFGAGTSSATHTYDLPGSFAVVVTAFDEDTAVNGTASAPKNITVTATANQVTAAGPYTILEGQDLLVSAAAAGTPSGFSWDINDDGVFGDITGQNASITWAELQALPTIPVNNDGVYTVSVAVSYSGLTNPVVSNGVTLTVLNVAPQNATMTNDGPVNEGSTAVVTISGQTDPSAADFGTNGENLKYSYDFDNDGTFEAGFIDLVDTPSVVVPVQFLADDGLVTIRAIIQDDDEAMEVFTDIVVTNVAPDLLIDGLATAVEGSPYSLSLSATDVGDDSVESWVVKWGDGVEETFSGAAVLALHSFLDDGIFTLEITAIDEDGSYQPVADPVVTVSNALPTLSNLAATATLENGFTTLTGDISDAGVLDSFTVEIDWGDNDQETVTLAAGTTGFSIAHRYLDDDPTATPFDSYTISVTVSDDDSLNSTQASTNVIVSNVAPTISLVSFVDASYGENEEATLAGVIADVGTLDTHTVSIEWGDGESSQVIVNAASRTFSATHVYVDDNPTGTPDDLYTATITVLDDDGGVGSANASVTVANLAPVITELAISPFIVEENDVVTVTGSFEDAGIQDTSTLIVDWGDGTTSPGLVDQDNKTFTASHQYLDDNPATVTPTVDYVIEATLTDDDGGVSAREVEREIVHTLDDPSAARDAIAAARDADNSLTATSFNLVYDGTDVPVNVADFSSAETLRQHVQDAVDRAFIGLAEAGDVIVSLGASNELLIESGLLLGDTTTAEAELAAARDSTNSLTTVNFDLVYDGTLVDVIVGTHSSAVALRDHVQAAVDQAVSDSGAGIAEALDRHPVFAVVVQLKGDGLDFEAGRDVIDGLRDDLLGDPSAAEEAIAGVRTGNTLDSDVTLDLTFKGMTFPVVVAGGTFGDASALRDHIQASVDSAILLAGAGSVGTLLVTLDPNQDIVFQAVGSTSVTVYGDGRLDVDGNGFVTSADADLILRFLFGLRGEALTNGLPDLVNGTRTTAQHIIAHLEPLRRTMLDPDMNSQANVMTDGLLIKRFIANHEGSASLTPAELVLGVVDPSGGQTPQQIITFLNMFMPGTTGAAAVIQGLLSNEAEASPSEATTFESSIAGPVMDVLPEQIEASVDSASLLVASDSVGQRLGTLDPNQPIVLHAVAPTLGMGNNVVLTVDDGEGVEVQPVVLHLDKTVALSPAPILIEASTTVVRDVAAHHPDNSPTELPLRWVGGADQALFTGHVRAGKVSPGVLNFIAPANFDHPQDDGGGNTHEVVVHVSDAETVDQQMGNVPVKDVREGRMPGEVNGGGMVAAKERGAAFQFLFLGQEVTDTHTFLEKKGNGVSENVDLRTWLLNDWLVHGT